MEITLNGELPVEVTVDTVTRRIVKVTPQPEYMDAWGFAMLKPQASGAFEPDDEEEAIVILEEAIWPVFHFGE